MIEDEVQPLRNESKLQHSGRWINIYLRPDKARCCLVGSERQVRMEETRQLRRRWQGLGVSNRKRTEHLQVAVNIQITLERGKFRQYRDQPPRQLGSESGYFDHLQRRVSDTARQK